MITTKWKINGIFKADAQKVADEIIAIGEEATPAQILEKARNEETELHKCFTWDDSVAAEKYRLQEARTVVRLLVIEREEDDPEPVRQFFKVSNDHDVGYKQTILIVRDQDEYKALLRQAKAELTMFKNKYKTLTELEGVFEAIDKL